MSLLPTRRPRLRMLDDAFVERIIDEAFEVLDRVGLQFENDRAVDLLGQHGQRVEREAQRVFLRREFVEGAIAAAPRTLTLWNVSGDRPVEVGGDHLVFDPGSAAIKILEPERRVRGATAADAARLARVVHHLANLRANATALVPSDVPAEASDFFRLYLAVRHCDKPVITGLFRPESFTAMLEIMTIVRGSREDVAARPLAIFDACPSSPLRWSELTSESIMLCAQNGVPSEIVSVPLTGATGPVTLSGTLVVHTAENLAGIALAQATREGAPVIYGGAPCLMDMRGGQTPFGAIETMMIDCAYAQIGRRFGLPVHAYMGLSDSKLVDAQAGYETGIGIILAALAGVNVVSGPGILDFITCQSLEKLIIDNEVCGMAYRLLDGIRQHHETMAVDFLSDILQEGHFLGHPTTRQLFRQEGLLPGKVVDRGTAPEGGGGKSDYERAGEVLEDLLSREPFRLPEAPARELERLVLRCAAPFGMQALPAAPH